MKNLKKLSVVFMLTALFSTSFTSCIDNEVDPIVETIYAAQADLIAAQAAVQNAEAALLLAQANAANAQAEFLQAQAAVAEAQAAAINAETAADVARWAEELATLVEMNDLAVAEAQAEMARAQEEFEMQMAALALRLEQAGAYLAANYANQYTAAMNYVSSLKSTLALKQGGRADLVAMLYYGEYAEGMFLSTLEADLATKQAQLQEAIEMTDLISGVLADPSTTEGQIQALRDEAAEWNEQKDTNLAEIAVLEAQIVVVQAEMTEMDNVITAYNNLKAELVPLNIKLDHWTLTRDTAMGLIEDYQEALDNYDGVTEELTEIRDAALSVHDDQVIVVSDLWDAYDASNTAWVNADAALTTLQSNLAALEDALETAVTNLAAEQLAYDNGVGPIDQAVTDAQADVITAQANLDQALLEYGSWKAVFEADPTGSTWFDGTDTYGNPTFESPDIGDHSDLDGTSFAEVLTWQNYMNDPVTYPNQWEPATWSTTTVSAIPADGQPGLLDVYVDWHNKFTTDPYIWTATKDDANRHFFIEVETDDYDVTNEVLLNGAIDALGDEEIFDNAPEFGDAFLGDGVLGGDNAYVDLWDAQLAVLNALDAQANFGNALAAAQEEYDFQKNLFENELALLDAAQALEASTLAQKNADYDAWDDANIYLGVLFAAYTTAQGNLDTHLATTKQNYMDWIVAQTLIYEDAVLKVNEWQMAIDHVEEDLAAMQEEVDEIMSSPYYMALQIQIHELNDMIHDLEVANTAIDVHVAYNTSVADALDVTLGAIDVDYWNTQLGIWAGIIAGHPAAIATAQQLVDDAMFELSMIEEKLAMCDEEIADLEAQIAAAESYAQALYDKMIALLS